MAIEIIGKGTDDRHLNLEKLEKGDYLDIETLRDASGYDPGENFQLYSFYVLSLRQRLKEKRGLICKCVQYGLQILTDGEASPYKLKQMARRRKGIRKDYETLALVDESKLSPEQLKEHRRSVRESAMYLAAQQQVSKVIRTERRAEAVNTHETMRKLASRPVVVISTKGKGMSNGSGGSTGKDDGDGGTSSA